jgi:hypothetical protein
MTGFPPDPDVVATVPTEDTVPGVVPSGGLTVTISPAFPSGKFFLTFGDTAPFCRILHYCPLWRV